MTQDQFWQLKLLARLHDPGEKALVLFRRAHEKGSVQDLKAVLKLGEIEKSLGDLIKKADRWASAADRPQLPRGCQIDWLKNATLVHPLTGTRYDLGQLTVDPEEIENLSFEHFRKLAEQVDRDPLKTFLAFWRFGPELREEQNRQKLGPLWGLLPADTRIPDHSIWDHLDLTSAFAGAMAKDQAGEVALLIVTIGPVQPFIAAARATSDLWAGSHLLSRLAWETMKPLIERLGPDAVIFPRLRGVPQVDLWLMAEKGLPKELFEDWEWTKRKSDNNPLFTAALPNRFVAVVPKRQAEALAKACERAVRSWMRELGEQVAARLSGGQVPETLKKQIGTQLEGFPEVHWAAVPFTLAKENGGLEIAELLKAMAPFYQEGQPCGFFKKPVWEEVLSRELKAFYRPNLGVLYPAFYDLTERLLAATKSLRPFPQLRQEGEEKRCLLTGEVEALAVDWDQIAKKRPAWAKEGERLGALAAIKRLWPALFAEEVGEKVFGDKDQDARDGIDRFVVSTVAMALVEPLKRWLQKGAPETEKVRELRRLYRAKLVRQALPRKLVLECKNFDKARDLVALWQLAEDLDSEQEAAKIKKAVRGALGQTGPIETYYGLLLMDGDRMGKILSGDKAFAISFEESFHPAIRKKLQGCPEDYLKAKRPLSPNRHMMISGALNNFALYVAPYLLEERHDGQLIYAGGDDVLAMLPVKDLVSAAKTLRRAYSGCSVSTDQLQARNDFLKLKGRLFMTLGHKATASAGIVVAHYREPLSYVLQQLRRAEKQAKDAGRDALCIKILKRSGGQLNVVLKWGREVEVFERTRAFLAEEGVSRRAVYHALQWLERLPDQEMVESLLRYIFERQSQGAGEEVKEQIPELARDLAEAAFKKAFKKAKDPVEARLSWLIDLLQVAEFLARQSRAMPEEAS